MCMRQRARVCGSSSISIRAPMWGSTSRPARGIGQFISIWGRLFESALGHLGDGDILIKVDILHELDQLDALFEGALEGLAAHDDPHAAGAFVDDRGKNGVCPVGCA